MMFSFLWNCKSSQPTAVEPKNIWAKDILGNADYPAISYGGYRTNSRSTQPTISQLKEDMRILAAMGIKMIRTYNVQLPHASNVIEAIDQLKKEDPTFEMYVMLGAWIDCENAWTNKEPNHYKESAQNENEVLRAVALAQQHPDIVKIIAIGNEAMVHWATSYYVMPAIILKWVNYVQEQKKQGILPNDLWVTSSDNFASWGGMPEYRNPDLEQLVQAVDYVSMHTYPMHDTHYNPVFWNLSEKESLEPKEKQIAILIDKSLKYAQEQYSWVEEYVHAIDPNKPIHIGETGWASSSDGFYGTEGSKACDQYKEGLYYHAMREWTDKNNISCFYFEAFDENWKDAANPNGSENHFGLFTIDGKAKYALWGEVDKGTFKNLKRGNHPITKTYKGDFESLLKEVKVPHNIKEKIAQ